MHPSRSALIRAAEQITIAADASGPTDIRVNHSEDAGGNSINADIYSNDFE